MDDLQKNLTSLQESIKLFLNDKGKLEVELKQLQERKLFLESQNKKLTQEAYETVQKKFDLDAAILTETNKFKEQVKTEMTNLSQIKEEWQKKVNADQEHINRVKELLQIREQGIADKERILEKKTISLITLEKEVKERAKVVSEREKQVESARLKLLERSQELDKRTLESREVIAKTQEAILKLEEIQKRESELVQKESDVALLKSSLEVKLKQVDQKNQLIAETMATLNKKERDLQKKEIWLEDRSKTLQSNLSML